eukprot:2307025-Prymnesium_polylepis.1
MKSRSSHGGMMRAGGGSPHSIRPGFVSTCPAKPPACVRVPVRQSGARCLVRQEPSRVQSSRVNLCKHQEHTLPLSVAGLAMTW